MYWFCEFYAVITSTVSKFNALIQYQKDQKTSKLGGIYLKGFLVDSLANLAKKTVFIFDNISSSIQGLLIRFSQPCKYVVSVQNHQTDVIRFWLLLLGNDYSTNASSDVAANGLMTAVIRLIQARRIIAKLCRSVCCTLYCN